jgi:hypothetical protein
MSYCKNYLTKACVGLLQFIALYLYLVKNEMRKETVSCGSGGSRNVEKEVKKVYLSGNFLMR